MSMPNFISRLPQIASVLAYLIASLVSSSAASAVESIRYPVGPAASLGKTDYSIEMLKLAVRKSGANVVLQPVRLDLNKVRLLMELQQGRQIDVFWGGATKEREDAMQPVRICLMKGLMGWRIPLVSKKNSELFAQVKNLEDLRKLSAGQGYHWTDTQILQNAGIQVERSYEYDNLLKMLMAGRFDYFPRSVMEIWGEVEAHPEVDMAIDPYVILHYPAAFYFYVHKENAKLAEILQRGLEVAVKDGSFNKLFYEYHRHEIINSHIENRRIIEIKNPYLNAKTPLDRKELWFSVQDLKNMN